MNPWMTSVRDALERQSEKLASYLIRQRWYRSKARQLHSVKLLDLAPAHSSERPPLVLALIGCSYEDYTEELYLLPLHMGRMAGSRDSSPEVILTFHHAGDVGDVIEATDAIQDETAWLAMAEEIRAGGTWRGEGRFSFVGTSAGASLLTPPIAHVHFLDAEQSNSCVVLDQRLVLKLFRKLEPGVHPDFEIMNFLSARTSFDHVPKLAGHIQYQGKDLSAIVGLLQEFVPNSGDGWTYTLQHLRELVGGTSTLAEPCTVKQTERLVRERSAGYLTALGHLGEITAKLHLALASDVQTAAFRPEPIDEEDVIAWRQAMHRRIETVFGLLRAKPEVRPSGLSFELITRLEHACGVHVETLALLTKSPLMKIRQHGDYHLGQVLKVEARHADDPRGFVVLDFEGEPACSLEERRAKLCALKDIAGMLRSFNYAAETVRREVSASSKDRGVRIVLQQWEQMVGEVFFEHYRRAAGTDANFLPRKDLIDPLLQAFQIDKAVYELGYEINNRPTWAEIPITALQRLCPP